MLPPVSLERLVVRFKVNTIVIWDSVSGQLREWPLRAGKVVGIERATLGVDRQVINGMCLASLGQVGDQTLCLACAPEGCSIALEAFGQCG